MDELDVAVVGGGPAGLSAALVLARAGRRVAVLDAGEPRNAAASRMQGFLSRDGMPPQELLAAGRAEVASYGGRLHAAQVTRIDRTGAGFSLATDVDAQLSARHVLVATGLRDEIPEVPGLWERWGKDVLHCPYCHGYEVRDQPLAVLGGSALAVEHALLIRQWSADLVLFPHTDELAPDDRERLLARGIGVAEGRVSHLEIENDTLKGLALRDRGTFPRTALFVRPTFIPRSHLLLSLGCAADGPWVIADASGRTSVPGVWVAGNVSNPRAQVITAAGEGSAAAIAINAALVEDDVQNPWKDNHS